MPKTLIVYDRDITEVAICFEDKFYNKTQKDLVNKKTQRTKRGLFLFSKTWNKKINNSQ